MGPRPSELADASDMTLPGVLKHVRVLEGARLVTRERNGRTRECQLGLRTSRRRSEVDRHYRLLEAQSRPTRRPHRTDARSDEMSHGLTVERPPDATREVAFDAFADPKAHEELHA